MSDSSSPKGGSRPESVLACVVSWNSADQLATALRSLLAQDWPDVAVVVVDNASADGSAELAAGFAGVEVVRNPDNRGFAGGVNQGVALARERGCETFLTCNPDVRLAPDYVRHAVGALTADERRAAVQGKLYRLTSTTAGEVLDTTGHVAFRTRLFRNRGEGQADTGQFDAPGEVFGVSGAVALYRVAALTDVAVNGEVFDEDLFAYWEDVDLDWRLRLRGWSAWYEPSAVGWHERGGAGPRRTAQVERLNFVNRFLVLAKNDTPRALLPALPGFALTSLLKAAELLLTVPSAFLRSFAAVRLVPVMLRKRRVVHAAATVPSRAVVAEWFGPFDYPGWVRTWWRRVRGR